MDLSELYRHSLALLTDLYQLTMAYGYWKLGMADRQAVFHLHFRQNPFQGGYAIACGLESVISYLKNLRFDEQDTAYLAQLTGNDDRPLFEPAFLDHLRRMEFACDVDAVPEGTVVFPYEPLVRVRGPLMQCQIIETALLTLVNFQTLIASKAARVCWAARGQSVLEFGLRRAQGVDGGVSASRAAYVGGCDATSNVLAGKLFGIPVRGTHAHSWVLSFDDELESFEAYAKAMPNNCVFLVDTYDTLQGVRRAVEVGRRLRQSGYEMIGVRLDSGDLAWLSRETRKILDEGGFPQARILASNDLDEHVIESLRQQGATIIVWGVGTRLATAYDQPALGGVYKLSAVQDVRGQWQHRVKLSEQLVKSTIPGILQVRRFRLDGECVADAIYDELTGPPAASPPAAGAPSAVASVTCSPAAGGAASAEARSGYLVIDPLDLTRRKVVDPRAEWEDLLVPVLRAGKCVYEIPPLQQVRRRTAEQLAGFHDGIKRFLNPHEYPAGLEARLFERRMELILHYRHSGSGT